MGQILELLKECESSCFYGDILIKMERGKIVIIYKTEKIKP